MTELRFVRVYIVNIENCKIIILYFIYKTVYAQHKFISKQIDNIPMPKYILFLLPKHLLYIKVFIREVEIVEIARYVVTKKIRYLSDGQDYFERKSFYRRHTFRQTFRK